MVATVQREAGIEWSVLSRALAGQLVSGDQHVVAPTKDGVLLAVIDGLGHGDEATLAARKAADVLIAHATEPVVTLIQRCHEALRATRGAAMTLVSIDFRGHGATALGVGNVEALVVRASPQAARRREGVLLRNGVVGYQLPQLQASDVRVAPGDVVVFATDGVREDFGDELVASEPVGQLVERVMVNKFRGTDDGLVLACRILGDES